MYVGAKEQQQGIWTNINWQEQGFTTMSSVILNTGITEKAFIEAPTGCLFGRIEQLNTRFVSGWVVAKGRPDTTLSLYYKGCLELQARTDLVRPDISHITNGEHRSSGFSFYLAEQRDRDYIDLIDNIEVRLDEFDAAVSKDFANSIEYCCQSEEKRRLPSLTKHCPLMISVVIPVYDRTQELRESINSVLNQTYEHFELVIIGDNPPQETLEVLSEYKGLENVRIFNYGNRSGNACRGRNRGILMARGDIIAFQDSDDVAFPRRLETLAYVFKNCGGGRIDMVYSDVKALTNGTRRVEGIDFGQRIFSRLLSFEDLRELNPVFTCASAVRRDTLLLRGGFRRAMVYREDHELWLRLAHHGAMMYAIPTPLSAYRIHSGNAELTFIERDAHWKREMKRLYSEPWLETWN